MVIYLFFLYLRCWWSSGRVPGHRTWLSLWAKARFNGIAFQTQVLYIFDSFVNAFLFHFSYFSSHVFLFFFLYSPIPSSVPFLFYSRPSLLSFSFFLLFRYPLIRPPLLSVSVLLRFLISPCNTKFIPPGRLEKSVETHRAGSVLVKADERKVAFVVCSVQPTGRRTSGTCSR